MQVYCMNTAVTTTTPTEYSYNERYINRELSILDFHLRVLEQAVDPLHPLLERMNFLLIFSRNMDEFFEITTWGQLGLHTKPIGILNINGYYDPLLEQCKVMVKRGFLKQENLDAVVVDDTIDGLLNKMNDYKPLPAPKWLNKEGL